MDGQGKSWCIILANRSWSVTIKKWRNAIYERPRSAVYTRRTQREGAGK